MQIHNPTITGSFGQSGDNSYFLGDLALGKVNPKAALDVSGDVLFSGSIYISGSVIADGQWTVSGSSIYYNNGNVGVGTSTSEITGNKILAIGTGSKPTTSPEGVVQLFASGSSARLFVRDESGMVTLLSPHNFSLIKKGPSHPMAFSHYSRKGDTILNIDMFRVVQLLERLTGEKLIHLKRLSP